MVLSGLAQRYLEQTLKFEVGGFAKGTVLEVKEEKGLGTTVDVIIYDGSLKKNDTIVIGGLEKPIVTKVKALLEPAPLSEMRDKKGKYNNVNEVSAATGVKISAPDLTGVVAGTPLRSCSKEDLEKIKSEVQAEVDEVLIETDESGIIVKADSLGSVEALINLLKGANITIRRASVGDISKKDISEAQSNYEKDPFTAVIIGFNVTLTESVPDTVKVITGNIIYTIMDKYVKWKEELTKLQEMKKLDVLVRPCKLMLMPNYVFRQNNPAIVGTEVLEGVLRPNTPLMNSEGKLLTTVKGIQHEGENLEKAEKGKQVAVSYPDVTVGRQVKEGDILYSAIPEDDFRKLKKLKQYLSKGELEIMREIADIMRKINVVWGV
jgi:translation initiation factor 5B